ncbi:recombinase family protein [Salinicola tamaricis]|uniref:recombinase family protein n=1 Tax=Salinicola tamaricis TaxID=1771309 RepID=UPI000D0A6845|nr:recombinase family protein [Salinicola tamaricis]
MKQSYIRGYLRASTDDQNATRAQEALQSFAEERGRDVVAWYVENASGASVRRTELERLLADAKQGDILLIEQVDRLTRLTQKDWDSLKAAIKSAGIRIVSLDLPTSHAAMTTSPDDEFTGRMLGAVNDMLLDMLAAVSRKDYDDRRRRQAEGIRKAKERGEYKGRPVDEEQHQKIRELRDRGFSVRKTAELLKCSPSTVQRAMKMADQSGVDAR